MLIRPTGLESAQIMLVQDIPGYQELGKGEPFQGPAGMELNRMLSEAKIMRSECFVTSLIRTQVSFNSLDSIVYFKKTKVPPDFIPFHDKHVKQPFLDGLKMLEKEIELVKPRVILAFGNGVLFALTGKWGIKSWRGSELPYTSPNGYECIIVPTYPPSYVLQVWKDRGITVQDLARGKTVSLREPGDRGPSYNFLVRPSFSKAAGCLQSLLNQCRAGPLRLSVDIETRLGHTACIGLAWSKCDAICIPLMIQGNKHYWLEEEEVFLMFLMYQLLTHENCEVIGQNFLYDAQYFWRWLHYLPRVKRDTMIAQHSMFSNRPKGLDYLSSFWCDQHVYWKDESKNWDPKLGEDQLWTYNCKDCVITYEVDEKQQEAITKFISEGWTKLREIHDFQQDLFWPVLDSMIEGIRVDNTSKARLSTELQTAIDERNEYVGYVVGYSLNIKSPKQMQDLFYRQLAQREIKDRKTGSVTTNDAALTKLGEREPILFPLLEKISELRSLGVFRSTFLEAPTDTDDRMRCSFNITGTETYRFSSSENAFGSGMNLQNVPSGDEESGLPNVRKLFLPDEDHEFFDIDLDSADLRIVVWESDCKEMKQMFAEGLKPYVEVAKEYYRDPSITKSHPSYKLFKALCHGTNYLGTPSGLAGRIGLLAGEVERIQKWYYSKFPEIEVWQDSIKHSINTKHYIENVFGYRWYVFDRIEGTLYNQAVAWIPQSTVACLINRGYKNLRDQHRADIKVLLQVHDSLAGQYHKNIRDQALSKIAEACAVPLPYEQPLIIPVGIKSSTVSWGDCQ
jgi:DNA polymerase I-like protein with 3'-5' exonuclease and polymerase domains/uracil-DNA glycosylase